MAHDRNVPRLSPARVRLALGGVADEGKFDRLTQRGRPHAHDGGEVDVQKHGVVHEDLRLEPRSSGEQGVVASQSGDEAREDVRDDEEDVEEHRAAR